MWNIFKRFAKEKATFETFFGWFIYLPWGGAFIYYGKYDLPHGYQFAFMSVGFYLIVMGLRKGTVNRVKQAIKVEELVQERKLAMGIPPDNEERVERAYDD